MYENKPEVKISVTGHRPKSMPGYGYDYSSSKWKALKNRFKHILVTNGCTTAYTGMALGVDTVFAQAVLDLKEQGHNIQLVCVLPFKGQEGKWVKESVDLYNEILKAADDVIIVSEGGYSSQAMSKRNEWLVINCDLLIAVWNGDPVSGTGSAIRMARMREKPMFWIKPDEENV